MKKGMLLLACLALIGCGIPPVMAAENSAPNFFRPGPLAPAALPEKGIYPQGRTLHLGGYSPSANPVAQLGGIVPLELAQRSGFTVAGPYYGAFAGSKAAMERAAALGLHLAAQLEVPPALRFSKEEAKDALKLRGPRMAALPEADLRAWVRTGMEQYLKNPALDDAVSCWAISPEELRHWNKSELAYQQAFVKAVNDIDPRHRPVFMYEPNNRTTESLLKTGPGQGFVLEGSYVHTYGWDVRRSLRINWAMDQMTGAAARDGRVVVPGLELSKDMPGFTARDLQADPGAVARLRRLLRHDVYLALARGARGFQVWSLFHSRPKMTTYLELMNGYGEVFRELAAPPLNLQEAILFGERRDDLALEVVNGPATLAASNDPLDGVEGKIQMPPRGWPSVRLASLAYGPGRVLLVVNSAAAPVQARLGGLPAAADLELLSGADAVKLNRAGSAVNLALEPFAAVVMRASAAAPGAKNAAKKAAKKSAKKAQPEPMPHPLAGTRWTPSDVDFEHPVYATEFNDAAALADWQMEGGRRMSVAGGRLVLESDPGTTLSEANANHLVCWLKRELPADFLLEFTVCPANRKQGLNIVFFNARGLRGESVFDPALAPRDGAFAQYHSGDLNCYHCSYWAGERSTANLRKNKGFNLVATGPDLVVGGAPGRFQTIRIYKRGGRIRVMVDGVIEVAWDDDGTVGGPVLTQPGWIALRQMAHTVKCEYDSLKVFPLKKGT